MAEVAKFAINMGPSPQICDPHRAHRRVLLRNNWGDHTRGGDMTSAFCDRADGTSVFHDCTKNSAYETIRSDFKWSDIYNKFPANVRFFSARPATAFIHKKYGRL
uniref:Pectin acetylesterase n=1 Tax=Ascaris lumbricoides TaxID=6252 RepID=A0A0M3HNZ2_ASCLU